jgi:hypothetical protein
MRYVRQELEQQVRKATKGFPATVVTGPAPGREDLVAAPPLAPG